ncbi:MAG TPA: RNA polymerase sigma factor [Actinopolymorphaceae bacterium]|jgi:RNA polymerase sigma factor (sigma-70 family)
MSASANGIEDLLRELTPQVLGALVRRYGHFDVAEDAVQEALLAAVTQWPDDGTPGDPKAWLIRVAARRLTDLLRSDEARARRESTVAMLAVPDSYVAPAADSSPLGTRDDSLVLLFLCCHPALSPTSQIALTLRAVGGLTTTEIARAFLVPDATMGQRISRAKQTVRAAGARFLLPPPEDVASRLGVVLHVLYLIFNEGYTATAGPDLVRHELGAEAIRLTRLVYRLLPDDGEVTGLLALMLLTDARRPARTGSDGELIPLADQDRGRWDAAMIGEGVEPVTRAMTETTLGPYQLQAAIAALHDEAPSASQTDWPQILALYGVLRRYLDSPVVVLNQAVAAAMVNGPLAGLAMLAPLDGDPQLAGHHRLAAARAHPHEMAGHAEEAVAHYQEAARLTTSEPERRYLQGRAARLTQSTGTG